jgi:transcriptional regulator with XRE-family HTH domain
MVEPITTELLSNQLFCNNARVIFALQTEDMRVPSDPSEAGHWVRRQRDERGLSAQRFADIINGIAMEQGDTFVLSQQNLSKFEKGDNKRMPSWVRHISAALEVFDERSDEDPLLSMGQTDSVVSIRKLPNFVGMGGGGSDDGEPGVVAFSRDLIERELRAPAEHLFAMVAEGNSMKPEFRGGDQILVDTRRTSLAQPGAFCLWDGDGHVVKFIEKMPNSNPPKVRVVSANTIYEPHERLVEEINVIGRVIWFGRRVQ